MSDGIPDCSTDQPLIAQVDSTDTRPLTIGDTLTYEGLGVEAPDMSAFTNWMNIVLQENTNQKLKPLKLLQAIEFWSTCQICEESSTPFFIKSENNNFFPIQHVLPKQIALFTIYPPGGLGLTYPGEESFAYANGLIKGLVEHNILVRVFKKDEDGQPVLSDKSFAILTEAQEFVNRYLRLLPE